MIKKKTFPVVFLASLISLPVTAQVAPFAHPAPPAGSTFEPIEDNPYFIQDADDPRFLLPAPGARERGIDRGYIQRMARPGISQETWDMLDDADAPLEVGPIDVNVARPGLINATVVQGNIVVIEGYNGLTVNTEQGPAFNHNGQGLQDTVTQVLQRAGDQFDFITVFTTFNDSSTAAYYLPLRQDVTGLGECNFNAGATFGCVFDQTGLQIQGFVFMNSLDSWRSWDQQYDGFVHDINDFDASVYAVLGQEVAHRWGSGLRFVDPRSGAISKQLLGRDESHWAAYIDSDGSVMDGWDWESNGDGTFALVDDMNKYSTLDLYTMGAQPVGTARPFFFIDNARFIPNQFVGNQPIPADAVLQVPSVLRMETFGLTLNATGTQVDLTVQDIVDAEGVRCPDPDNTQKTFKQAFVLVTRPGQTVGQVSAQINELQQVMETWEDWWSAKTDNALSICTDLLAECVHVEAELGRGDITRPNSDGGELVEPGDDFVLEVGAKAIGEDVTGAVARVRLLGNGAEFAKLDMEGETIQIGALELGGSPKFQVPISLDDDYPCGISLIAEVTLISDNAPRVREEYRIFPGYEPLFAFDFDESDDEFTTNDDGLDDFSSGGMSHSDLELSCFITPRTPDADASPGGQGAWVTGNLDELNGETSLWSGRIPLDGAVDPEIRFNYWLDYVEGERGKLTILISETGKGFTEAKVYEDSFHGWILGRVRVRDVYDTVPSEIHVIMIFEGEGQTEGAIDDFTVLDRAGQCRAQLPFCGCSSTSGDGEASEPTFGALALIGLAGVFALRRRRRD